MESSIVKEGYLKKDRLTSINVAQLENGLIIFNDPDDLSYGKSIPVEQLSEIVWFN